MAEQVTRIEAATPRGVYLHSIANVTGTAAEQTFMTIMNPAGSGKSLALSEVAISYTNTATASSQDPLRGWRITSSTGGTLIAPGAVARFNNLQPDPIAEVRVGNPTIVKSVALFNSPPPIDNKSSSVHSVAIPPNALFVILPGEGLALNKLTGATTVGWNLTVVWAESY